MSLDWWYDLLNVGDLLVFKNQMGPRDTLVYIGTCHTNDIRIDDDEEYANKGKCHIFFAPEFARKCARPEQPYIIVTPEDALRNPIPERSELHRGT